jgi:aspartate 1-decarboxylase
MVLRTFLAGKIHGVRLTDKHLQYQGSITLSRDYLEAANILPNEAVQVVNVTTGARLLTYAILTDEPGHCALNGGAARLGEIGDQLIVMSFVQSDHVIQPRVVLIAADNRIVEVRDGEVAGELATMLLAP